MESKRKLTNKNYADIENNKNILFCTDIFWVGQMHYGPPKEIFGWAMAHPKYRVAPQDFNESMSQLNEPSYFFHKKKRDAAKKRISWKYNNKKHKT
jgi:hypothetical protein